MRTTLTDKFIQAAKSVKPQTDYFDAVCAGLSLRVTKTGKKTWTFTYTSPTTQKRTRIKLGTYPATTLTDARTRAGEAKGQAEGGSDPRAVKAAKAAPKTVAELIDDRVRLEVTGKLRSAADVINRYAKCVVPVVGNVPVKDFKIEPDLNAIIDPILARGAPIQANLVFADVRRLFNFAVQRGVIPYSPLASARMPSKAVVRQRFLTTDEVSTVWAMLPMVMAQSRWVPTILKLCLVTGQRVSEVAGMSRDELDLGRRFWTIPADRSKNGHAHVVPLSDLALDLLREPLRKTNGPFLFPNDAGNGPLVHYAIDRTLSRCQKVAADRPLGKFGIPAWRPHDLRRTVATHMSRRENGLLIPHLVIGHVLNHRSTTKAGVTQGVYDQNDFLDEKREALDKWGAFLSQLVGCNVVNIDQGSAA